MANANRDFIVEKVKEVLAAPSCCPELKDAAQKYLPRWIQRTKRLPEKC